VDLGGPFRSLHGTTQRIPKSDVREVLSISSPVVLRAWVIRLDRHRLGAPIGLQEMWLHLPVFDFFLVGLTATPPASVTWWQSMMNKFEFEHRKLALTERIVQRAFPMSREPWISLVFVILTRALLHEGHVAFVLGIPECGAVSIFYQRHIQKLIHSRF
jgi:hypothetical protein